MSSLLTLAYKLSGIDATSATPGKEYLEEVTKLIDVSQSSKLFHVYNENEKIDFHSWINFVHHKIDNESLQKLNLILAKRSYLVGSSFTIADVLVFAVLHEQKLIESSFALGLVDIMRWVDHIQHLVQPNVVPMHPITHHPIVFPAFEASGADGRAVESSFVPKKDDKTSKTEGKEVKKEKKDNKSAEKKADDKAVSAAATESKPAAPVAEEGLDPSKLEIKVGLIVKCWNHPESDKLLCEEIDLAEGSVRTIASGLRAFYTAEEMQGKKVLVLANLKERPMAGFKSQGMVLCAIGKDHSEVKLLEPPSNAQIGDRVDIAGFSGEPAQPNQVAKKKIFESLAPFLRTNEKGLPTWNNIPFTIKGEHCLPTIPLAVVS